MEIELNRKYRLLESSSIKNKQGLTLIELLVVLVILSILASVALPYAKVIVQREKEIKLRSALREIRTAIDYFHKDWKTGKISRSNSEAASQYGYPLKLSILVEGVQHTSVDDVSHKYLRRIPINPLADPEIEREEQWQYRSYQDEVDTEVWGGQDVYDVNAASDKQALNGTFYKNW